MESKFEKYLHFPETEYLLLEHEGFATKGEIFTQYKIIFDLIND